MPHGGSEAEWLTRKKRIDTRLRALHPTWQIIRYRADLDFSSLHGVAIEELPTGNGPADYALFVNGQLLGIIEAKKVTVNPQNVLEQAKRYAEGATNGPGNWQGSACGRGGFLVCSYEWLVSKPVSGGVFDRADARRIKSQPFIDQDLVPGPRLLAGQLVPKDPTDEPAEKLLEKIGSVRKE